MEYLQTELALEGAVVAVLHSVLFQIPDRVEEFSTVATGALLILLQLDGDVVDFGRRYHHRRQ